jgi:hypothetical protein
MGDDVCRGLLQFGVGQPLGPGGLRWLRIHLANSWGHGEDKRSFDQRDEYVRGQMHEVGGRCWPERRSGAAGRAGAALAAWPVWRSVWLPAGGLALAAGGWAAHGAAGPLRGGAAAAPGLPCPKPRPAARLVLCPRQVLDSARDPLGGRRWWMGAEKPWQALAACKEIAAAVDSGGWRGALC